MIDLVFEIRRAAPEGYRPEIKFTNPELLNALKSMSEEVENGTLRTAVERLLKLVDGPPPRRGEVSSTVSETTAVSGVSHSSTRVYRGHRVAR